MKLALYGGEPVRKTPLPERTPYGEEEKRELMEAIDSQELFYLPPNKVDKFEKAFAEKYGVKHAICSTSGTSAIHTAVAALDANPGDEIVTSPVTDFGTIAGIIYQGLIPVFADWKPDTFNTDPEDIERKITDRTRAILPVHLFGNPNDMDAIMDIAKRHNLPVIEDCCQAYCTYYKGKLVGTIGDIGCFSMQQSKHLTTGDGGVTITNSDKYADIMMLYHDKGWANRHAEGQRMYTRLGLNYRMNELTAAVALAQLPKVENTVNIMRKLGDMLTGMISDIPGILPAPVTPGGKHSYWIYPTKITGYDPKLFVKALNAEGLDVGCGYTGKPIYSCSAALAEKKTFGNSSFPFDSHYTDRKIDYSEGLCPVAEAELPMTAIFRIYESWTEEDIQDVAAAFRKVAEGLANQ
jgi:dTDP-4-amino-4,6-dideoxygalactose transaminase